MITQLWHWHLTHTKKGMLHTHKHTHTHTCSTWHFPCSPHSKPFPPHLPSLSIDFKINSGSTRAVCVKLLQRTGFFWTKEFQTKTGAESPHFKLYNDGNKLMRSVWQHYLQWLRKEIKYELKSNHGALPSEGDLKDSQSWLHLSALWL